jgi:hypothetical protein
MPHILGSSVSYRIVVGPQQGRKAFMIRTIRRIIAGEGRSPQPPVTRTTIPGTARDIASFRREGFREFTVQPAGKPLSKRWHGFLRIAEPE